MRKIRILSALVGIPIILLLAWLGKIPWAGFILLLALTGLYEYMKALRHSGHKPLWFTGYILMVTVFMSHYLNEYATIAIISALVISIVMFLFYYPHFHIVDLSLTWLGALYVGLFMSYISLLGFVPLHFRTLLVMFLMVWASDTAAYFAGMKWGRRKLAVQLSPNKTWEGFWGGYVFTVAAALSAYLILPGNSWNNYLVLGLVTGIVAPIGDLFASGLKRSLNIKDFGNIIPGHGGILDRFDSMMLAAPVVYYFVIWWGGK